MRWSQRTRPCVGDRRIVRRFLVLPRALNKEWRWLERASIEQRAYGVSMLGEPAHEPIRWRDERWAYEHEGSAVREGAS